ncbi:hypothetical protein JOF53_004447 [Crossiella equi]|uniref:Secreted protein n=1 Tax=Crossiella equi TaxID=130796 RepID=A0ABS5AG61_9PSEU|nr:hypothetical protein [Crossiella equi]MBP2475575.1 hypothetical protein [Crossiella equi]
MRRLLSRALVVSGTAFVGWMIAAGSANAAELASAEPVTDPVQSVAQVLSSSTEQASGLVGEVRQAADQGIRRAVAEATSVISAPERQVERAENPLGDAVHGVAKLLQPTEVVAEVVEQAGLGQPQSSRMYARDAVWSDGPSAADVEATPAKAETTPAVHVDRHPAPQVPSTAPVQKPGQVEDAPRQQPQPVQPGLPLLPLIPLPMPVPTSNPGSCSCGHDGSDAALVAVGGYLPLFDSLNITRGLVADSAAADCVLAGQAKAPGITPD